MENEKDLLKKDLENQDTEENINKFIEDAELLGHEDIVLLAKQKLADLEQKAKKFSQTSEIQEKQISDLDGSVNELEVVTKDFDDKIEEVKEEAEVEIENLTKEEILTQEEIEGKIKNLDSLLNRDSLNSLKNKVEFYSNKLDNLDKLTTEMNSDYLTSKFIWNDGSFVTEKQKELYNKHKNLAESNQSEAKKVYGELYKFNEVVDLISVIPSTHMNEGNTFKDYIDYEKQFIMESKKISEAEYSKQKEISDQIEELKSQLSSLEK